MEPGGGPEPSDSRPRHAQPTYGNPTTPEPNQYDTPNCVPSYDSPVPTNESNNFTVNVPKSILFNYSIIEITEAIEKLINKGLNFSVLPNKLDITQVLVDYKR